MRVASPADWSTRTRFVAIGLLLVLTAVLLFWAGSWDNESAGEQPTPSPSPSPTVEALLQQVDDSAALPTSAGLAAALAPLLADPDLGGSVGISVADVATKAPLYSVAADRTVTSASIAKVLTATAALSELSPQHRFTTEVVVEAQAGSTPTVTIVGGGDPGLGVDADDTAPTGGTLTELAAATASGLTARGIPGPVTLRYDDSLFAGSVPPTWPPGYVASGVAAPVSALRIGRDEDEVVTDPAGRAAAAFADALTAAGVSISGQPARAAAPGAPPLASVESAQLAALVERMLVDSDNDYAEILGRQVAIATGAQATNAAATSAITSTVADLGVDVTGIELADASGLSRSTRLPASAVTAALTAGAAGEETTVAAGLSVAGFNGTLADRFDTAESAAGAGLVRAKTGTLTGVGSLAGLVVDADGRLLAFAVIADSVPAGSTTAARDALDRIAAALAACGCR